jgi:hypothetical protein
MTPRLQWIVKLKRARYRHLAPDVDGSPALRTLCGKRYSLEDRVKSWKGSEKFTSQDCRTCGGEIFKAQCLLTALARQAGQPIDEAMDDADHILQVHDKR